MQLVAEGGEQEEGIVDGEGGALGRHLQEVYHGGKDSKRRRSHGSDEEERERATPLGGIGAPYHLLVGIQDISLAEGKQHLLTAHHRGLHQPPMTRTGKSGKPFPLAVESHP